MVLGSFRSAKEYGSPILVMCKLYDGNGLICKLLYLIGDTAIINVSPSLFAQSHFMILKITSIVAAKIMPILGIDQTKSVNFLLYNVDYGNNGTNFFQTTGTFFKQRVQRGTTGTTFFVFWASAFFLSNNGNNFLNEKIVV